MLKTFGLIGYPLSHSFSGKYFSEKFEKENITDSVYKLFSLKNISEFRMLIESNSNICGLNVTIPYKESIIPFLDSLDETAKAVGAVNTIKIIDTRNKIQDIRQKTKDIKNGNYSWIGYNTDVYGFRESLKPLLNTNHERALILGTGGAAKAVAYVLKQIGIDFLFVTRNKKNPNFISYYDLNEYVLNSFHLIINTTLLGTYPNTDEFPPIPYEYITNKHFLYDLVYNPEETLFLEKGKKKGALTQNGLTMLYMQAEKAWKIWNNFDEVKFKL